MKKLLILLLVFADASFAQTYTLQQVQELARQNYPLIKQKELIQQTREISIANLQKGYLPQFALNGQATYQSDVTRVKIPVPGVNIEPPGRDQYRVTADVNQTIYDGGLIKQQKKYTTVKCCCRRAKTGSAIVSVKRANQYDLSWYSFY